MNYSKSRGFTLIELMIVMVIVAILAGIAYPSYQSQVTKTRRSDGQAMLMNVMQAQERGYTTSNTYTADLTDLGYATAEDVPSEEGFYEVTAAACGGGITECVVLTAVPQGGQADDGNLTLDSLGQKTPAEKW